MNSKAPFWVNDCLIDPELNLIIHNEETQTVEPRVMAVLIVLFESVGSVVPRDELINRVWGDRVTSDSSLSRNIALLRKLIDKSGDSGSCIKTVPKKGYMLLETCVKAKEEPSPQPVDETKVANNDHSIQLTINKKQLFIAFGIISLIFMGWFVFQKLDDAPLELDSSTQRLLKAGGWIISPDESESAFCFDGLDDFEEIESQPAVNIGTNDYSLSAWIKTSTQDIAVILDKRNEQASGNVRGYNFHVLRGELGAQLADGDGIWRCIDVPESSCTNFYSGAKVADNQWHFVAVTVDRDNPQGLKFYVDGELVNVQDPTTRMGSLSNNYPLRVGSRSSSKSAFFPGKVGEIKIHHYALSADDIQREFSLGNRRKCGR